VDTNSYRSSVTPTGKRPGAHAFGNALKAKLPTALCGLAALVCVLSLAVAPTQYVAASTYLNHFYNLWKKDSVENDFQQTTAQATLDSLARRIRH
jgi:hypothetical protein